MGVKAIKPPYTLPLTVALAVLLIVLAVLQFDWLNQVSLHQRQEHQTNLRNRALNFQQAFNLEIDRIRSTFKMGSTAQGGDESRELRERFYQWNSTAVYGELVKNVFLAELTDKETLQLTRFDSGNDRFENVDWSTAFGDLRKHSEPEASRTSENRKRFEENEKYVGEKRERSEFSASFSNGPNMPVVVQPIVAREPREKLLGFCIVTLNFDYIKDTFIPSLAKRHFGESNDYDLMVLSREGPRQVIYSRGRQFAGLSEEVRSRSNEELPVALNLRIDAVELGKKEYVGGEYRWLPKIGQLREAQKRESWQLLVQPARGSLEAVVSNALRRNLAVSFGILAMLAISIVIIIVTARRAQRLAKQQMEFVAGVSHEFRTPLAVIHAISENLADGLITDRRQIEECGLVIRNDVRRLAGMVEQILQFAGTLRGKNLYQPQPVDLPELINDVLARHPALEAADSWQIEKEIEPDLPRVLADPTALECAVRNIVDNAVKYGGEHRWIGIKATTETADKLQAVRITISDRGRGIQSSDFPHIFEPFYRGREVIAAQIHGNGLGLSLVKKIVEAHGGSITLESVPGEGSSFTISLPAENGKRPPL